RLTGQLRPVRLLHTSGVHIAGDEMSIGSFTAVVDAALDPDVDMVLIAGDLFDSGRVGNDAIDATVKQLGRLAKPVVVIPGNHDCIDEYSIYHRVDLRQAGDHVFLAANPAGEELLFDEYSVSIWARGIENHEPAHRPLQGCPSARPGYWRVVL